MSRILIHLQISTLARASSALSVLVVWGLITAHPSYKHVVYRLSHLIGAVVPYQDVQKSLIETLRNYGGTILLAYHKDNCMNLFLDIKCQCHLKGEAGRYQVQARPVSYHGIFLPDFPFFS